MSDIKTLNNHQPEISQEPPHKGFEIKMAKNAQGLVDIGIFKEGIQQGFGVSLDFGSLFRAQNAIVSGQAVSIKFPPDDSQQFPLQ